MENLTTIYHLFVKGKIDKKKLAKKLQEMKEDSFGQSPSMIFLPGMEGEHHYFGSLKALTDSFEPEELGISIHTLYRHDWDKNPVYENDNIIIRQGELIRKRFKKKTN